MHWTGWSRVGVCLATAVVQVVLLSSTFCVSLQNIPDEGTIALQAMRVAAGQLPHRDYFLQTPFGTDGWIGLWFSLLGSSLESLRLFFLLQMGLMAGAIHYVSTRIFPKGWSEVAPLCFMLHAPFCWYIPSPRWDAALFILLALCFLERHPVATGCAIGLAALAQHPAGAAGFLALTLTLATAKRWREVYRVLWGVHLVWLPYLLWLAYLDSVSQFFLDTIFFNLTNYVAAHRSGINWHSFAPNFLLAFQTLQAGDLGKSAVLAGYAVVDLVSYGGWYLVASVVLWISRRDPRLSVRGLAMILAWLTLQELVRPNRYHFYFHLPFVILALVYLLQRLGHSGKVWASGLVLAHLLVGVGHIQSALACRIPVRFPRGILYVSNPARAQSMRSIIEVNRTLPPQEKLFVFPDDPQLQWLLGRAPVTREVAAFPCFYSYSQFLAIREALDRENVENLLYVPMHFDFTAYPTIDPRLHLRQEQWLVAYFTQDYQVYAQTAGVTFFRRKEVGSSPASME